MLLVPPGLDRGTGPDRRTAVRGLLGGALAPGMVLWFAVIPAIAISLQATIFVTVSAAIGHSRPDVPHLDPALPTSSYPSGHVGASVALYTSLAVMATTIERTWLKTSTGRR